MTTEPAGSPIDDRAFAARAAPFCMAVACWSGVHGEALEALVIPVPIAVDPPRVERVRPVVPDGVDPAEETSWPAPCTAEVSDPAAPAAAEKPSETCAVAASGVAATGSPERSVTQMSFLCIRTPFCLSH
ncbi:hypothetical protein [Paraburkholderia xenovorans]